METTRYMMAVIGLVAMMSALAPDSLRIDHRMALLLCGLACFALTLIEYWCIFWRTN